MAKGEEKEAVRSTDWRLVAYVASFVVVGVLVFIFRESKLGWYILPVCAPLYWLANKRIQKISPEETAVIRIKSVKPRRDSY